MAFTAFRGMKPFPQLMFTTFVVLVCFLVFMLLSMVVAVPLFGVEALFRMSSLTQLSDPETIRMLKFFQVIQSIGLFIIPPLVLAWLFHGKIAAYLSLNRPVTMVAAMLVVVLVFVVNPAINFTGSLNADMNFPKWLSGVENWMRQSEDTAARLTDAFLKTETTTGLLFNLFMIAVLPALGEELLFRGVVQQVLTRWTRNAHAGIWLAAALFSALHMQFFGFLPRLLLGVLFGYLLLWSGSLWLPILAHFVNNGAAVLGTWYIDQGKLDRSFEEIGAAPGNTWMAMVSILLTVLVLWAIRKQYREQRLTLQ